MAGNGTEKRKFGRIALCVAVVVAVLVFVLVKTGFTFKRGGAGAGGELPVVVTNRMADAAYQADLLNLRREQGKIAAERNKVVVAMERKVAAAKTKFPEAARAVAQETNKAVRAELQKKLDDKIRTELEKDPEWKNLELENQKHLDAIKGQLAKAREVVRSRMARERADAEAVKQGRARVAD